MEKKSVFPSLTLLQVFVMKKAAEAFLPSVRLEYEAGELIIKEGDYGVSIYHVIEGKVEVFTKSEGKEISISILGPGEIIGEMSFLTGYKSQRSASVKTVVKSVLEAWHPSRIAKEFEAMPFVVRYIANQTVNHLTRLDRMISTFKQKDTLQKEKKPAQSRSPTAQLKRAIRKDLISDCLYRPIDSSENVRLWGRIKNISKGGLRLDILRMNALDYSHVRNDEFKATVFIKNEKQIDVHVKIVNSRILEDKRTMAIGMQIIKVGRNSIKDLGFLLIGKDI